MPSNTPNLNIPKLTDSDNFNTTTFGEIVDAIDQNAAKKQTLDEHKAENTSNIITSSRSLNVTGVQSITLYGKVQAICIEALINGTKIASKGYYIKRSNNTETQYSIATLSDGSMLLSSTDGIVIRNESSTIAGKLAIVGDKLNITWTILSGSPTELVNLFITTWSHGG